MQSTIESLNRLTKKRHKVSAHYLIDRSGKIFQLVDDLRGLGMQVSLNGKILQILINSQLA